MRTPLSSSVVDFFGCVCSVSLCACPGGASTHIMLLTLQISVWDYELYVISDRLLQSGHVGPEDGCGGPQRAGEDEISCSGTADGPVSRHMDAAGVSLVYLPLHWHSPDWGERKLERVSVNLFQTLVSFTGRRFCGSGTVFSMKAQRCSSVLPWLSSCTTSRRSSELTLCPTCVSVSGRSPLELFLWTVIPSCRWRHF